MTGLVKSNVSDVEIDFVGTFVGFSRPDFGTWYLMRKFPLQESIDKLFILYWLSWWYVNISKSFIRFNGFTRIRWWLHWIYVLYFETLNRTCDATMLGKQACPAVINRFWDIHETLVEWNCFEMKFIFYSIGIPLRLMIAMRSSKTLR